MIVLQQINIKTCEASSAVFEACKAVLQEFQSKKHRLLD